MDPWNKIIFPFSSSKRIWAHLQLASEASDMKKVLVAGAAVRAEGQAGGEEVEEEEKEEKTHFLGKISSPD